MRSHECHGVKAHGVRPVVYRRGFRARGCVLKGEEIGRKERVGRRAHRCAIDIVRVAIRIHDRAGFCAGYFRGSGDCAVCNIKEWACRKTVGESGANLVILHGVEAGGRLLVAR